MVYVKWLDAAGSDDKWVQFEQLNTIHPSECETIGWLLQEENSYIVVAPTISTFKKETVIENACLHPLSIIRTTIIHLKKLRFAEENEAER